MNNPVSHVAKLRKPFNLFHTHVIDRKIMNAALASKKSLEIDISITPDGSIYVGHPLAHYKSLGLPPPDNLPLDEIVREAKAAGLFLVFDLKNAKVLPKAQRLVDEYGADDCLVHSFAKELSFEPWPPKVMAEAGPCWRDEELPLEDLLKLKAETGVPLALSCHGMTQDRLQADEAAILKQVLAVTGRGVEAISFFMPQDEETPLPTANKLIEHGVIPLINPDRTKPENLPFFFLGFTDYLTRATLPSELSLH